MREWWVYTWYRMMSAFRMGRKRDAQFGDERGIGGLLVGFVGMDREPERIPCAIEIET